MRFLTTLFTSAFLVYCGNVQAAWQFSSSESLAPVEFGSPATFEMRINNIGDSESPPSTLFALRDIFSSVGYSTTPQSVCSAWRSSTVNSFDGFEFDIPAIPAGESLSCRYTVTQSTVNAFPLTLHFRTQPNISDSSLPQQTLFIGALGDFSATATLRSDQVTNNERVRRFELRFNNASPHQISRYGVSRCTDPPVAPVTIRVGFAGACRTNGSGPVCFMGSYPGLRGDDIPANSSVSCDVDLIGENVSGLGLFRFMQATRADGRLVLDTNASNDALTVVGGTSMRVAAPGLNPYGVSFLAMLLGLFALRRLQP
jgi:hypothetical protein